MTEQGYIYCFSNPSYINIYKIGQTKDIISRLKQLNSTGILHNFEIEFAKLVYNYKTKEKKIHKLFDKYRVNKKREFFKISLDKIKSIFELIDGEWFSYESNNLAKDRIELS